MLRIRISRVRIATTARDFLFSETSRPTLGPTRSHILGLLEALFTVVKRPGCEADHLASTSAEVKNQMQCYTSTTCICLHSMDRDSFTSYVSVYGLFNDAICSLDYIVWNGRMISEMPRFGRYLGLIEIVSSFGRNHTVKHDVYDKV